MDSNKLFEIFGAKELVEAFENLDFNIKNKILQSSFKKAGELIINNAKGNLQSYNRVKNSLGMSYIKNEYTMKIGAIKTKGGQLAHIANSGTKQRSYTKDGVKHNTGMVKATYFWDNAIKSSETAVQETIFQELKNGFEKQLKQ